MHQPFIWLRRAARLRCRLETLESHFVERGTVMIRRRTLFGAATGLLAAKARAQSMIDAPIATTAHGPVGGATEDGILVFKGIPYGATTAGAARFHAPAPAAAWSAVRDALAYPPMAPQSAFTPGSLFTSWTFDKEISEDCLALNVWTPGLRHGAKRPVMVWFHGGDYSSLSGSRNVYNGVRPCQRGNVVVVAVNHRVPSPTGRAWLRRNFSRKWDLTMRRMALRRARELFRQGWPKDRVRATLREQHRQRRDLRRTGIVRMAEAGVPLPQIAAISGHQIDSCARIIDTYLPRRTEVAIAAMAAWEAGETAAAARPGPRVVRLAEHAMRSGRKDRAR